jgi:hypothetical protein
MCKSLSCYDQQVIRGALLNCVKKSVENQFYNVGSHTDTYSAHCSTLGQCIKQFKFRTFGVWTGESILEFSVPSATTQCST